MPQTSANAPKCRAWLAWMLVALVAINSLYWGAKLRRYAWDQTTNIRFTNSVSNAIEWGCHANQVGVLNVYDNLVEKFGPDGDYKGPAHFALDYPPLRLRIASWWSDWAMKQFPPPPGRPLRWQPAYEFTQPMLRLNMVCEIAASVGMFLLVYHWLRVCRGTTAQPWFARKQPSAPPLQLPSTVALAPATLAAVLLYFNPAVIFNAHVYPQWDVWLLPPFIFAMYCLLRGWWLAAGLCLGLGAMAKGQVLFASPLLIGLPLLRGQIMAAFRMVIGLAAAVGCIVWPWLLKTPQAQHWMLWILAAAIALTLANLLPRRGSIWAIARLLLVAGANLAVAWSVWSFPMEHRLLASGLVGFASLLAIFGTRWWAATCFSLLWAGALALTVPLFHASMAWYDVGIKYGTRHWRQLFWCHASNLGSILQLRFQWKFGDTLTPPEITWLGLTEPVRIRSLMIGAELFLVAIVVIAAARHQARRDPKLLLSIAAPFMLAYALLPQMVERYMLWPAALLSAYAAISVSGLALWAVLSFIAIAMTAEYMLGFVARTPEARYWLPILQPTFPDLGWAVLVLAGVIFFLAITPTPNRHALGPLTPPEEGND